jgi:hypothetical protein
MFRATSVALLCAATVGSFACVTAGNPPLGPGEDAGGFVFEDAGLLGEDAAVLGDSGLVVKDGAITLSDGAVVLVPADAPSPDYTTDLSSVVLQSDAHQKVSSLSGAVDLDFHTVAGDAYLPFHDRSLSGSTFSQLDGLWTANASGAVTIAADAGTVAVAASSLVSIGDTLPETSSVVVMRREGGVTTYQLLVITFDPH